MALLLAFAVSTNAFALELSNDILTIDIPDDTLTYYYTDDDSNMSGTMLENAQKQEVLFLVGHYGDSGTLLYTFKGELLDGPQEEAAEQLRRKLEATYALSEPGLEIAAGREGLVLRGTNQQNENFQTAVYVFDGEPCVAFTSVFTPEAEEDILALLDSVQWIVEPPESEPAEYSPMQTEPFEEEEPVTEPEFEREPDAVPLPGVTWPEETEPVIMEPEVLQPIDEDEASDLGDVASILDAASDFVRTNSRWLLYAAGGLLAVLGVTVTGIALVRRRKDRYKPRHARIK